MILIGISPVKNLWIFMTDGFGVMLMNMMII